jgi:hypothetical protein
MKTMMRMRLLDYSLMCALAALSTGVAAQEAPPFEDSVPVRDAECGADEDCTERDGSGFGEAANDASADRTTLEVAAHGAHDPVTVDTDRYSSSEALQPDRRVTVSQEQSPGEATATGRWSVELPAGGVIWATEDPNLGQPELNVSAPSVVAFDGRRIVKPVPFYLQSNYSAFIDRVELRVYRASDVDLIAPLATVPLSLAAAAASEWDGELADTGALRAGDELVYVVRAYGKDDVWDETYPRRFQLVRPDEAERNLQQLRRSAEKSLGSALTVDQALQESLVERAYGENGLRRQNIVIHGSRVRIYGRDLPDGYTVTINGNTHPVDLERKFAAEYLEPVGHHVFDVQTRGPNGETGDHRLDVDVTGRYLFAVGLADVTVSRNSASRSVEALPDGDRLNDNFLIDGRLAFYAKAKVKGKYLVTAQADTQEREVSELFTGFWKADPQDVFRRLDPNLYYPVYGDDSTVSRDVDTQGRLYLRVDWDRNQALWGNFDTGLTGTEYGQYSRALYGGAVDWRSRQTTALGDPSTYLRAFASDAQSAPGHSEFLGTGGSLYYLKHTDILPGSERLVVEVRDSTTGRVENRTELQPGADYQINNAQGRVVLTRPLLTQSDRASHSITTDAPLSGLVQVLLVDYEFVPDSFKVDTVAAGVRAKQWFGDHLAVGTTLVDENRAGDDYTLKGADVTLQAGKGTYLKVEQSQTQAISAPVFFSDNGGLDFSLRNPALGERRGKARAVEARANFRELGWAERDASAGMWWREVDAGYSIARFDTGTPIHEQGVEFLGDIGAHFQFYTRYSLARRGDESLTQGQVTGQWRMDAQNQLSAEIRRVDEKRGRWPVEDAVGTLGALRYQRNIGDTLELSGTVQKTLDNDGGKYRDNDAVTVAANYLFGDQSTVGAEVVHGDRGNATRVNGEYRLDADHSFYGAYTQSTDHSSYDPLFNPRQSPGWTVGQRWRLSNQVSLYNESQFLKEQEASGLAHTFGMDFFPADGWNLGYTLQKAKLDKALGRVNRDAASVSAGRSSLATQWQSKLEWRRDSGLEKRDQWVTTNRLTHRFSDDFRVALRANYSRTEDRVISAAGARYAEAHLGFAWRPFDSTRWTLLGKYTWLYDVSALPQEGPNTATYDQRSRVLSFEGIYAPDNRWELAGKAMHRDGQVRYGRLEGRWANSAADFAAGQVRYRFAERWHSMAEYRYLVVRKGGARRGALVGVDRDVSKHFRVGVGYSFADFSDDLTDFKYDHRGVFLNVVGKF